MIKPVQRLAILVDSENLEISVSKNFKPSRTTRSSHNAYPNWTKILPEIVGKRSMVRCIYYKKKGLAISSKFRSLWERELGGEILQPSKSVDPYIIVDAITLAEKVDVVLLLAGDKDYLPLVWYLRSRGCKVEIASFADSISQAIRQAADKVYILGAQDTLVLESGRAKL